MLHTVVHGRKLVMVDRAQVLSNVCPLDLLIAGAYTEIVIRGGPGVEVEVNLVSAEVASRYRPRGVWGHAPPRKIFEISITNGAL